MIREFRNKRMVANALEILHKGGQPPKEEIAESVAILTPVVDLLEVLGERYNLMWGGLNEDLTKLRQFKTQPVPLPKEPVQDLSLREINTQLKNGDTGRRPIQIRRRDNG